MVRRESSKYILLAAIFFFGLISLPFIFGRSTQGDAHVFGGILLNPLDGNTYLAKMYQGFRGDTIFTLPYSSDPGAGAFINMYYLFLGHLARVTGISQVFLYNLARIIGSGVMFFALLNFFRRIFPDPRIKSTAIWLSLFGSGMGWLGVLIGLPETADFWVAEAFPFLSAYTNPHFPLGLGLIVWLLTPPDGTEIKFAVSAVRAGLIGGILGLVSPFGVAIVLLGLGGVVLYEWWGSERFTPSAIKALLETWSGARSVGVFLGGGAILIYDYLAIQADPVLRGWDRQNVTTSPSLLDLLLSFSPLLILAIFGCVRVVREKQADRYVLLAWFILSWTLVFFPFALQRRFLMGIFIPVVGLAVVGIEHFLRKKRRGYFRVLLFLAVIPTNILVVFAGLFGVQSKAPLLFLYSGEAEVFSWIEENTDPDALILAAPEAGLFIPAYTGRRVLYGHPFETVNAEAEKMAVLEYFTLQDGGSSFLRDRKVDYLLIGPREKALGELPEYAEFDFLSPAAAFGDAVLFKVGE